MLILMAIYAATVLTSSFPRDVSSFMSLLMAVNYGNTYYILFWRSRDYRKAFHGQLLFCGSKKITVAVVKEIRKDANVGPIRALFTCSRNPVAQ
ncbi:unnamed protein product [Gongylonema pulchrum]|uniref:G_PROTEIN_RECEP_F1_2 domain-containing protein n=1 Tax=Gongylonema pulchrum TaxID=637853 RepID=A0A183DMD2_9BILA|nr:unnamed protein product [Gongylonema pulchrum]